MTDSVYLPAGLILISTVFFGLAITVMLILDRIAVSSLHSKLGDTITQQPSAGKGRTGGSFLDGVNAVATSPYLLGIDAYIVLLAISNTLIYFTQANIALESADTFSQRVES